MTKYDPSYILIIDATPNLTLVLGSFLDHALYVNNIKFLNRNNSANLVSKIDLLVELNLDSNIRVI